MESHRSLLCTKSTSLSGNSLESSFDGLYTTRRVTSHTLKEEQTGLLVEDGIWRPAGVAGDILLDITSEYTLYVFLLESTFHNKLITSVNSPAGPQLREQEGQQVLGLSVEHLRDLSEVCKCSFLAAHSYNLRWSHDKLLLLSSHHLRILVSHNTENSLEQLIIKIITIRSSPGVSAIISLIFLLLILFKFVKIDFFRLLSFFSSFFAWNFPSFFLMQKKASLWILKLKSETFCGLTSLL